MCSERSLPAGWWALKWIRMYTLEMFYLEFFGNCFFWKSYFVYSCGIFPFALVDYYLAIGSGDAFPHSRSSFSRLLLFVILAHRFYFPYPPCIPVSVSLRQLNHWPFFGFPYLCCNMEIAGRQNTKVFMGLPVLVFFPLVIKVLPDHQCLKTVAYEFGSNFLVFMLRWQFQTLLFSHGWKQKKPRFFLKFVSSCYV